MYCTVPHCSEGLPLAHVVATVSAERERKREREGEKQTESQNRLGRQSGRVIFRTDPTWAKLSCFPSGLTYMEEDAIKDITSTCWKKLARCESPFIWKMSENQYTNMIQPSGPDRNKWVYTKMNTAQQESQNSHPIFDHTKK